MRPIRPEQSAENHSELLDCFHYATAISPPHLSLFPSSLLTKTNNQQPTTFSPSPSSPPLPLLLLIQLSAPASQ